MLCALSACSISIAEAAAAAAAAASGQQQPNVRGQSVQALTSTGQQMSDRAYDRQIEKATCILIIQQSTMKADRRILLPVFDENASK